MRRGRHLKKTLKNACIFKNKASRKETNIKLDNLISGKRDTAVLFCYDKRDTAVSTFYSSCCFIPVWRNTSADFLGTSFLGRRTLRVRFFSRFPLHKKTDKEFSLSVFLWSGKRDSNSRRLPWQGNALPLSHSRIGGNNRARTYDPLLVRQMLSQLSYAPVTLNAYILYQISFNIASILHGVS